MSHPRPHDHAASTTVCAQEPASFIGTEAMMSHSGVITKATPLLIGAGLFLSACTGDFAPTVPDSWLDFEDTAACINQEHCHLEPRSLLALLASLPARSASAIALR